MKLDLFETHDRYQHFTKQNFSISECVQDIINQRPFGSHPFYIFAHPRTEDNDASKKRLIWQPRLTKPIPQTNSMLFKVHPGTDQVKIIWMIPDRHLWPQYTKGLVTESSIVTDSIRDFQYNRRKLEARDPDDLTDEQINNIYKELSQIAKAKRATSEASKSSLIVLD